MIHDQQRISSEHHWYSLSFCFGASTSCSSSITAGSWSSTASSCSRRPIKHKTSSGGRRSKLTWNCWLFRSWSSRQLKTPYSGTSQALLWSLNPPLQFTSCEAVFSRSKSKCTKLRSILQQTRQAAWCNSRDYIGHNSPRHRHRHISSSFKSDQVYMVGTATDSSQLTQESWILLLQLLIPSRDCVGLRSFTSVL